MALSRRFTRTELSQFLTKTQKKAIVNSLGTLKYRRTNKKPFFGVITSSAHQKKAVLRNRLKRRIRSIFSKKERTIDAVVYVAKKAYSFSYEEIQNFLEELIALTAKDPN